jgi:hypothetical protein
MSSGTRSLPNWRQYDKLVRFKGSPLFSGQSRHWSTNKSRMTEVTILALPVGVAAVLGAMRTIHCFRGRAMFALAARLGFRYIGPRAPARWWWNPPNGRTGPDLPSWVSNANPCGLNVRQIWNVMEGQHDGIPILIFDALYGARGGQPLTAIVCQTERSPYQTTLTGDHVYQSHRWALLRGTKFLGFSWTMSIQRLEDNISNLQPQ